jgi:hypothetical protein
MGKMRKGKKCLCQRLGAARAFPPRSGLVQRPRISCRPRCRSRIPRGGRAARPVSCIRWFGLATCYRQTDPRRSCAAGRRGRPHGGDGSLGHGGATVPLVPRRGPLVTTGHYRPRPVRVNATPQGAPDTSRNQLPQRGGQPPDAAAWPSQGRQRRKRLVPRRWVGTGRTHHPRPGRRAPRLQGACAATRNRLPGQSPVNRRTNRHAPFRDIGDPPRPNW